MANMIQRTITTIYSSLYERLLLSRIFREDAQTSHERVIWRLAWADGEWWTAPLFRVIRYLTIPHQPTLVGGVVLSSPLILAAGFVKGVGFADEGEAFLALAEGGNLIPGWRTMPALVGAVEFGSYTRHPRMGSSGTVMWRDAAARSTQNRIGLRNPGARAAAAFLANNRLALPKIYGINLAPTPGLEDTELECAELVEALYFFLEAKLRPAWMTLNLSCPNTEDDPTGNQTEAKAWRLCQTLVERLTPYNIPLWVKISPALSSEQYAILVRVFANCGVRAVIATNTLGMPTPDGQQIAGVGGDRLRDHALPAVRCLAEHRSKQSDLRQQSPLDIIGCGGVMDGKSLRHYRQSGAAAFQYWSALVYRGPLAAAVIAHEQ